MPGSGRDLAAARRRGSRCRRASSSARLSAWLNCDAPARSWAAVSGRSAHIRTAVFSPTSDTSACTGPVGSTSSVNRARHTRWRPRPGLAAAIARDLELRHRRALRRHERDFEMPARRGRVDLRPRSVDAVRQRSDLQQRLPRDRAIGLVKQMMRGRRRAAHAARSRATRPAGPREARRETAAAACWCER